MYVRTYVPVSVVTTRNRGDDVTFPFCPSAITLIVTGVPGVMDDCENLVSSEVVLIGCPLLPVMY